MEGKLPEDQVKSVLAPWRFSWQSSGFENRLVTAMELYEHFPLDIAVTGGTKSANARLASAVCGLKDDQETEKEVEDEEEEDDEKEDETDEDEDSDEQEDEDEQDDRSSLNPPAKVCVERKSVRFTDDFEEDGLDFAPVLFHPNIPNVRILTMQGSSAPAQDSYDVLVVLTTELHQEDNLSLIMEQCEKNKTLYLVKTEQEFDLVRENLAGPCKTCAWERMRARTLEFQKKHKVEFDSVENAEHQKHSQGIKLLEPDTIAGVLVDAIPELRKKAFSQFLVDLTSKLKGPKTESYGTG